MARKPMITRTIVTTDVTCICVDITKGETFNETIIMPRTYTDDKKLLKAVQNYFDTDERKAVSIVNKKEIETLYGMDETTFINNAVKLDNETRKPLAE